MWDTVHDEALPEAERQRALTQARLHLDPPDEPSDAERLARMARRLNGCPSRSPFFSVRIMPLFLLAAAVGITAVVLILLFWRYLDRRVKETYPDASPGEKRSSRRPCNSTPC